MEIKVKLMILCGGIVCGLWLIGSYIKDMKQKALDKLRKENNNDK